MRPSHDFTGMLFTYAFVFILLSLSYKLRNSLVLAGLVESLLGLLPGMALGLLSVPLVEALGLEQAVNLRSCEAREDLLGSSVLCLSATTHCKPPFE